MRRRDLSLLPMLAYLMASAAVGDPDRSSSLKRVAGTACKTPDRSEVRVPGGTFLMGSQEHEVEEGPVRRVTVDRFSIDRFDVTNGEFAKFVAATGYVTEAERKPDPKDYPEIPRDKLASGGAVFKPSADGTPPENDMEWWGFVEGASWRHPYGSQSGIVGRIIIEPKADKPLDSRWLGSVRILYVRRPYSSSEGVPGNDGPELLKY